MAVVVFLKGVNVGGYRTFRPSELAKQLKRYDVVNIGAAGTLVVRKRIARAKLRAELTRRLPFEAEIMICSGDDVLRLVASAPFEAIPVDRSIIHFVSVLRKRTKSSGAFPIDLPADGVWGVRVMGQQNQFVYGMYRRQMKAIGYLGELDKIFGAAATTRSWSTIVAIARILQPEKT
jgi:uncharacterized protein (DUF1697 family)